MSLVSSSSRQGCQDDALPVELDFEITEFLFSGYNQEGDAIHRQRDIGVNKAEFPLVPANRKQTKFLGVELEFTATKTEHESIQPLLHPFRGTGE